MSVAPITLNEVGPRDGLQSLPYTLSVGERLRLIEALLDAGFRHIEVTSFVHPRWVPQHDDAEVLCSRLDELAVPAHFSAYTPNARGIERALSTGSLSGIAFAVGVTDELTRHNIGTGLEAAIAGIRGAIADAHGAGLRTMAAVSGAFGCPYTGDVGLDDVLRVIERLLDLELDAIQIADTIGTGTPGRVAELGVRLRDDFPDLDVTWHFHDTFGMGIANVLEAAGLGFTEFDAAVGAIGGCPFATGAAGNVASEELVYALRSRYPLADAIDLPRLVELAVRVRDWAGGRSLSRIAPVGIEDWTTPFLEGASA